MHTSIDFPRIAQALLQSKRFTTRTLGEAIGLSQPSVSRLARGKNRDIGATAALKLIELAGGEVRMPSVAAADVAPADQEAKRAA